MNTQPNNGSFISNVNRVAENMAAIISANENFNPAAVEILQEIADLNLQLAMADLAKGNFLGNRKIDIDFAANKTGVASADDPLSVWNNPVGTVYYSHAVATFIDGTIITIPFVNDDAAPIHISTPTDFILQLNKHTAFNAKLNNTSIIADIGGLTGIIVRITDIPGDSSNLDRLQLFNISGSTPVETNPNYFWAKSTSAFQTLANRQADIIKLGNKIDSIITLSENSEDVILLADNIAVLQTLSINIAAILAAQGHANTATTKASEASGYATVATDKATIATNQANTATAQAVIAAQKAAAILGLTVQVSYLVSGSTPTVSYNSADGKITFGIPQGPQGPKGDNFQPTAQGLLSQRSLYDARVQGFSFLAEDTGTIYFKLSATSGDWSVGAPFGRGDKGDTGDTGNGIVSIGRTAGDGSAGTTDTYTIVMSDTTTHDFTVYNGADSDIMMSDLSAAVSTLNDAIAAKARVDDAIVSRETTFSSQEIVDRIAANATATTTPTISAATLAMNEASINTNIAVQNYETGLIYRFTSSDDAVINHAACSVTSSGQINIPASTVTVNTAVTLTMYAKTPGMLESAPVTITVTVNDVPLLGDDEYILRPSFSSNLSAIAAEYIAPVQTQGVAETAWKQYKAQIVDSPDIFVSNAPLTVSTPVAVGDTITLVDASGTTEDLTITALGTVTTKTLDPATKGSAVTLSNGNLTATSTANIDAAGCNTYTTTTIATSGKLYAEVTIEDGTGSSMVGVSTVATYQTQHFAASSTGYGYYSAAAKYNNNTSAAYGTAYGVGSTIGVLIDETTGQISFRNEDVDQGVAYTITAGTPLYIAVARGGKYTVNVGATPFKHALPEGYKAAGYSVQIASPTPVRTPTKAYFIPKSWHALVAGDVFLYPHTGNTAAAPVLKSGSNNAIATGDTVKFQDGNEFKEIVLGVVNKTSSISTNVALLGKAFQSSTYNNDIANYGAQRANNGVASETYTATSFANSFDASGNGMYWWAVKLAGVYTNTTIKISPYYAFAVDYKIQSSLDGVAWTDIHTVVGDNPANWTSNTLRTFNIASPIAGRYIRILVTKTNNTSTYLGLSEVEVWGVEYYYSIASTTPALSNPPTFGTTTINAYQDALESTVFTSLPKSAAANILLSADAINMTVSGDARSTTVYIDDNNAATGYTGVAVGANATTSAGNTTFAHGLASFLESPQTPQVAYNSSDMASNLEITYSLIVADTPFRTFQKRIVAPIVNSLGYLYTHLWKSS